MQKQQLNKKIVITGGGSGGHISVAISLLAELEKRYDNVKDKLLYIGGDLGMEGEKNARSMEEKRLEGTGYAFSKIRAGKFQRVLTPSTIPLLFRTILGFSDAYNYLKQFKPDLVISTGGFVTVPVSLAASLLKIPLYLHEQTAAVGLSNRIASKIAKKIFVTFPQSLKYFPPNKTKIVGNPIRESIFKENQGTELLNALKIMKKENENLPILYVSGGGQGSHLLNIIVRDALVHLLDRYQIILQTGDNQTLKDYEVLENDRKKLPKEKQSRFFITKFVTDFEIGSVFKHCNLFIGRSGANTVYELGVLGKPCILIPIPWVTHNEQYKNARILEEIGLATILPEGQLSRESLLQTLQAKMNSLKGTTYSNGDKRFSVDASSQIIDSLELS